MIQFETKKYIHIKGKKTFKIEKSKNYLHAFAWLGENDIFGSCR